VVAPHVLGRVEDEKRGLAPLLAGGAVFSEASSSSETRAISSTARSNAASLTCDGLVNPLISRTYCSAAADLVLGGGRIEGVERHDVPAHDDSLSPLTSVILIPG
jgi:hypothetical protein